MDFKSNGLIYIITALMMTQQTSGNVSKVKKEIKEMLTTMAKKDPEEVKKVMVKGFVFLEATLNSDAKFQSNFAWIQLELYINLLP